MTRYLLDTGIAADFINKRHGVFERANTEMAKGNPVGIGIPVLAELVFGIEKSRTQQRNQKHLARIETTLRIWPFDKSAAHECGRLLAEMESRGRIIQFADAAIAAIAIAMGNTVVVSKDSDFFAIPNLMVENWAV